LKIYKEVWSLDNVRNNAVSVLNEMERVSGNVKSTSTELKEANELATQVLMELLQHNLPSSPSGSSDNSRSLPYSLAPSSDGGEAVSKVLLALISVMN
jgi:hypothetical protein